MKLAEALQERSDLNCNIIQLKNRLINNSIVQENEKTAEDPNELLSELDDNINRLRILIERINQTNSVTVSDGKTITSLIAERDSLKLKISVYRELVNNASQTGMRARMSEIKILSAVDVKEIQKKIDKMSKELRLTDNLIQSLNWSTELV